MTHDLGIGRWRRRATTVPVEEDTAVELALTKMLDNAENRLIRAQSRIENAIRHLGERQRWAGKTQAQIFADITDELIEVHLIVTGGTK